MITIREVAKRASVSVGTVSNVLSESERVGPELRRRVDEAMRALDYSPNQIALSLKTRWTKTLGTIVSDITNPFFAAANLRRGRCCVGARVPVDHIEHR